MTEENPNENESAIEDLALEYALQKLVDGEDFALAGLGRRHDGELEALVVQAEGEDEMMRHVREFVKSNPVSEIALVGTGQLEEPPTDILVVYAQTMDDAKVVCLIAPYEMSSEANGETEIALGEWARLPDTEELWVTPPPVA